MSFFAALFCLGLSAAPSAHASSATKQAAPLPLQRVRLYEIGVAYYERRGRMSKGRHSTLPLPTSHIDDALKTLVVLSDDQKVRIGALSYQTTVARDAARVLAGLPEGQESLGFAEVLASLEGQRVRVEGAGKPTQGRVMRVNGPLAMPDVVLAPGEKQAIRLSGHSQQYELLLLTDAGKIQRVRTDDIEAITPLDEGRSERLDMAAQSLSATRAQQSSGFEFEVLEAGELALGYVGESALWGINYRLVLDRDEAKLQAWALVHNDGDEDWRDVDIELVNGEPRSFIFAQASPHYLQREIETDDRDLYLTPQLAASTADDMIYGVGGLGLVGYGRGGGGTGEGTIGMGSVGTIGHGSGGGYGRRDDVALGDLASFAQADGSESGAQFVYRLPSKVDLEAHHSALLPVFTSAVDGTAITYWDDGQATAAVRLENDTRQTLPAGTISMFSGGGFSGEARLPRMKPGEAQFVFFGLELDVEVDQRVIEQERELVRVENNGDQSGGVFHFVQRGKHEVTTHNRAGHAKKVVVALDLPRNAKLSGASEIDWDESRQQVLIGVPTPASSTAVQTYSAETNHREAFDWEALSDERLLELAKSPRLQAAHATALRELVEVRKRSAQIDAEQQKLTKARAHAQGRLEQARKDLAALGSGGARGEAVRKAAKRMRSHEARITELDADLAKLENRREQAVVAREQVLKQFKKD